MLEKTGRWDEALALSREILDRVAPASVTRLCPLNRIGTILGRRGDPEAWIYLDEAIAAAEGTGEPQSIVPVRLGRAEARWLEGRTADALREAELADDAADTDDGWLYGAVAAWLQRTGSARLVRADLAEPYQHQVNGHWEKAAQLWTRPGLPVRGRAGPAGRAGRDRATGGARYLHHPRRVGRGAAHPAAAACARRPRHPGRPQVRDPG